MMIKERAKYHRTLKLLGSLLATLAALAVYLGYVAIENMKDVIREQFNNEQLVLARITANRIVSNIQAAITDLILLNSLPAVQYCDPESYEVLMLSTLPVLNRDYIIEIRRVDRFGETLFVANEHGVGVKQFALLQTDAGAYLSWASDLNNRGKTMGTGIRSKDPTLENRRLVMDLIIPTYEDSTNSFHPRPSQGFAGYLKATVDVSRLLSQIVGPVKSGRTGYAWVIDSSGIFLYHPENSFIGENAFEARANRNPRISFAKINEIQRHEMLKGKEGVGQYYSGWHRDVVETMEKLIAFAPVRIEGPYMDYVWSVAVVAPAFEVDGIVGAVYGRHFFWEALVLLCMLILCFLALLHGIRWSHFLEDQVNINIEQVQALKQDLEQLDKQHRALLEISEDLVFTLDGEGIIKRMNQFMSRLFGVGADELAGQSLYCLLPLEQAEVQMKIVNETLRTRQRATTETSFRIHDQDFWFYIQYVPIFSSQNSDGFVLALGRDVTERKSLEKQLVNTEKLASLGTLAAGVAHEINNPLGIMLGFCELLLEKMSPGTMEYNDLKTIERHGLHCKSIVERLLNFARISEESDDPCDINASVEAILAVVRHTVTMNNITLVSSLADDLPLVAIDSKALQQVLLNLISNSIHALNGNGVLSVTTRRGKNQRWVELIVADTGCGIKKEFRQRIFDPFFTTKKVGEGTGLGLSVSYGIVSKVGGTVSCESYTEDERPEGPGTIFTVSLPSKKARHR